MKMGRLSLKDLDFQTIANEFRGLNPNDIGAWPLYPRMALLVAIFLFVLAGGWWFFWSDQLSELSTKQQEEQQLRDEYLNKKRQAINLDLYTEQLNEIDRSFGNLLKQLPNKSEVDALLSEINQAGIGRGLTFDLFRPGQEALKDFYAELPVAIRLTGNYHDFGAFAEDVGKLSRIVTLNNISIVAPDGKTGAKGGGPLVMEATAKTFRYLDEEEVAGQKKAAKAAGGKKK